MKKDDLKEKLNFNKKQQEQIHLFKSVLLTKNQKINLVSRKNPEEQIELLLEELFLTGKKLEVFFNKGFKVLDIGSGNGFPGLLFAVFFPKDKFYLCERVRKKAETLKNIAHHLKLSNIEILCKNSSDIEDSFERILSQAVRPSLSMLKGIQKNLNSDGLAFLWSSKKAQPTCSFLNIEPFFVYKADKAILKLSKKSI